jgi:hypothetical protein
MSKRISKAEFEAHIEAHGLNLVKADGEPGAIVERAVDSLGCTMATAIYAPGGKATYIEYTNGDREPYIVTDGEAWPEAVFEDGAGRKLEDMNDFDWARVEAVDAESALALAAAIDAGKLGNNAVQCIP